MSVPVQRQDLDPIICGMVLNGLIRLPSLKLLMSPVGGRWKDLDQIEGLFPVGSALVFVLLESCCWVPHGTLMIHSARASYAIERKG